MLKPNYQALSELKMLYRDDTQEMNRKRFQAKKLAKTLKAEGVNGKR